MDELQELLARLSGAVSEEDMADPTIAGLMSQLMAILEPQDDSLPAELIQQLSQITDKKQRFAAAVQALHAMDINQIHEVAEKMKAAGLLKGAR